MQDVLPKSSEEALINGKEGLLFGAELSFIVDVRERCKPKFGPVFTWSRVRTWDISSGNFGSLAVMSVYYFKHRSTVR